MSNKISYVILILVIITLVFLTITQLRRDDMIYVRSDLDGENYLVRNTRDKKKAANLLASIKKDILLVSKYLTEKAKSTIEKDQEIYGPYKPYIEQLERNLKDVVIEESAHNTVYTSYTVNKGESIVFCIRSKSIAKYLKSNNIHDKNLVMYVALHEIAHVACPEYGHTPLFKKIFRFIMQTAVLMGLYTKVDFDNNPVEYCGMNITDHI